MRTIAKIAHLGHGGRSPLADAIGHVRRALGTAAERRSMRPHQDLDGWSDQAEVAFYEGCRGHHCP